MSCQVHKSGFVSLEGVFGWGDCPQSDRDCTQTDTETDTGGGTLGRLWLLELPSWPSRINGEHLSGQVGMLFLDGKKYRLPKRPIQEAAIGMFPASPAGEVCEKPNLG